MKTKSALQLRAQEMQALAIETFGSKEKADIWLHKENLMLGAPPISLAKSASGLMEVKKILNTISYGGVV
jgi:uncharacterized protein (DUF2384 family)